MKQQPKYFIFNKDSDFVNTHFENAERVGDRLHIGDGRFSGAYISCVLDSRDKDMDWHRLVFTRSQAPGAFCRVTIYAANALEIEQGGQHFTIRELIADTERTLAEKMRLMQPFEVKQSEGADDIILHDVSGRYLWFAIEAAGATAHISDLMVHFPRRTWMQHLPEVYRSTDKSMFLERYLAIFQTLNEELNTAIRDVPLRLDVDLASTEVLESLAGWIDVTNSYIWSESQLRQLLKNAVDTYKRRGTGQAILDLVRLYTGGEVHLVEYHRVEPFLADEDTGGTLTRLYGLNPYVLTVIIKKEYVPTQKEFMTLTHIINEIKPAQMDLNLVVLEPYMFLGSHTYLGINSVLGEYRETALNGTAMIPFSTITLGTN